jgi:hypothetical protein
MKAWADISLGNKITSPPIFHPLPPQRSQNKKPNSNSNSYMGLISHYKSLIEKPIFIKEAKYTTISMGFSHHMVQACMSMAQSIGSSSPSPTPTPFEALAGLFWVTLSKIKGLKNGLVDMSICLDMRKILGLDQGFFGNSMLYNKVHLEEKLNLNENKFPQATRAIRDVVSKIDNEEIMDLIEWLENNYINSSKMMNGHDLVITSLEDVDPYLAMFQDMFKPIRFSCYIEPVFGEGHVLILPNPLDEGPLGRVVIVTLEEKEAIKLCEDEFILLFSPTILMECVNK